MKTYYSDDETILVIFVANGLFTTSGEPESSLTFYKYDSIAKVCVRKYAEKNYLTIFLEPGEKNHHKIFQIERFNKNYREIFGELQKRFIEYQNRDLAPLLLDIKESLLALVYAPGGSRFETAKKSFEENTNHLN